MSDDGTIVELEDCGDRIMQLVISFDSQGKEDARLDFSDLKFKTGYHVSAYLLIKTS